MQAESAGPAEAILLKRKRDKMIKDDMIKQQITFGGPSILAPLDLA